MLRLWLCFTAVCNLYAKVLQCSEIGFVKLLNINKYTFSMKKVEESGGKWGIFCTFACKKS